MKTRAILRSIQEDVLRDFVIICAGEPDPELPWEEEQDISSAQAASTATQEKTAGDIYKIAGPSVVLIETYGDDGKVSGSGSGFLVSAEGRILTNFHVIEHTKRATVRLANEDAYDAVHVLAVDKRKDIALLLIDAADLSYLRLGRSESAQIGAKLYTLGTPLGFLQNTLSEGLLSGVRCPPLNGFWAMD